MLEPFGVRLMASDPYADRRWAAARGVSIVELPDLLRTADIISIHASQSRDAPLRLGAGELASMRRGAWLVNVARGDMVDDVALAEALAAGHLAGAALDVFPQEPYSGPLCDSDRVILSPHQATLTAETRGAMELKAVENLVAYLGKR
jgi:D-3-phosphoglycerate dehydrogenase / 2-oxoglutarate reductase